MKLFDYLPFIILFYFSTKFLIKFLQENIDALIEQRELLKIDNGILSINDLQKDNQKRFQDAVNLYLTTHGYENIAILTENIPDIVSIQGYLNGEKIYINSLQNEKLSEKDINDDNWSSTCKDTIQSFLGRMVQNNCQKGLIINNSTFSDESFNFVKNYNAKNIDSHIILVDGYELTRSIRNYKNFWLKVGNIHEDK